jgi:Na+/proline symporter
MKNIFKKATLTSIVFAASSLLTSAVVLAESYDYEYDWNTSDDAAEGFLGLGFGLLWLCFVCCLPIIISSVLAYIVYKDAKKNNVENGPLWAVLTFFFNLIGILVYFLAIRPEALKKSEGVKSEVKSEPKKEEVKEEKKEETK